MDKNQIKKYINLAKKANALIYGLDNIKKSKLHIYLIIYVAESGNSINRYISNVKNIFVQKVNNLNELLETDNCKIVALTNKNLAEIIYSKFRGEI